MVTPGELTTLAQTLLPPNDEITRRAAHYLGLDSRDGLETAHNLITDVATNLVLAHLTMPLALLEYEEDLYNARIDAYGSIGRQPDMTAPYWRL